MIDTDKLRDVVSDQGSMDSGDCWAVLDKIDELMAETYRIQAAYRVMVKEVEP